MSLMEFCLSFRIVSPPLGLPPAAARSAISDPILAGAYRRKIGHIESWKHLPEEGCILGQLHVLPSVLLHNLKDVERKEEEGPTGRERGGQEGGGLT